MAEDFLDVISNSSGIWNIEQFLRTSDLTPPDIVFPGKGGVPHPHEMSNGDLDGGILLGG